VSVRALVVDDNRPLAEDLAEILAAEGYEVAVFDDPRCAAQRARDLKFEIALLDVRMPGLDGVALHRLLVALHPEARFVLMTAYADDELRDDALRAGVARVISKPVGVGALLQLVAELTGPRG
jgi:CheY-like chemotaxis protein